MYNFCRWYPSCKIIFMAPTKPLVAQQLDACAKIMGIKRTEMCEMTGHISPDERKRLWQQKRVFFLTPQTLTNDLLRDPYLWTKVRCLVVDEAHRATGNYAYCQVIQALATHSEQYRVLALSATPGNSVEAVQQVIDNLKIAHIELRTDDSLDIKKYSFEKVIEKIIVKPNPLMDELRSCILDILKHPIEQLHTIGILPRDKPEAYSQGVIVQIMHQLQTNPPRQLSDRQIQEAKTHIFFAITFYHALQVLEQHGLRPVYTFFKKKLTEDKKNSQIHMIFRTNSKLGSIYAQLTAAFDLTQISTQQRCLSSVDIGHPKLIKLRECVVDHFRKFEREKKSPGDQTRVIIFSEKRESVKEITEILTQEKPLIKPMAFVGQQSGGITQKQQKKIVNDFRLGGYNTLVATCIGEEGLDIGDVDLIVCFDALKSPIRLIQRMGRTGRKRQGRIVLLMTEGKEERTLRDGELKQRRIYKTIVDGQRTLKLYSKNPRMLPSNIHPTCQEMNIKFDESVDKQQMTGTKRKDTNDDEKEFDFDRMIKSLTRLFRKEKLLSDQEYYYWMRNFRYEKEDEMDDDEFLSNKDRLSMMIKTCMEKWSTVQIQADKHSTRTQMFVNIMKFIADQGALNEDNYADEMDRITNLESAGKIEYWLDGKRKDKNAILFQRQIPTNALTTTTNQDDNIAKSYMPSYQTITNRSTSPTLPSQQQNRCSIPEIPPSSRMRTSDEWNNKLNLTPVDLNRLFLECETEMNLPANVDEWNIKNDQNENRLDDAEGIFEYPSHTEDDFQQMQTTSATVDNPPSTIISSSNKLLSQQQPQSSGIPNFDMTLDDLFANTQV
ncbi:unnamed protein product, partial [Didymodactylos carnosus]